MSVRTEALYTFNSWAGNMTLLSSSTSLMLRTIALWERKLLVVVLLGILCVAHWAVLWRGMFIVESTWNAEISACYVTQTNPGLLNVTFFYTIAFDFTVLIFTTVALTYKHSARTDLWKLLFQDGLVYFLLTFSSNCIPAVLNVLNLNAMMNVIATIPAASISSILACRCVMRLLEFNTTDVYVHTISGLNSIPGGRESFTPYTHTKDLGVHTKSQAYSITRPAEVVITTEHYSMAEFASPSRTTTPHEVLPYHASSVDLEAAVRSRSHSRADDLEMSAGSSDDCTTTASQKAHTGDV
ncbi:hypothetical protein EV715DRAFT_246294 [Schizophyllum commune]